MCNQRDHQKACPDPAEFCSCIHTVELDLGDVVEFIFIDEAIEVQANHPCKMTSCVLDPPDSCSNFSVNPVHLHGYNFAVVGMAKLNDSITASYVKSLDAQGKLPRNLDNPPVKDTVTVPAGGYTIVRFVADNPGTWMMHCHLEFHFHLGMRFLVKVGTWRDLPPTPPNWPRCGNFEYNFWEMLVLKVAVDKRK